MKAQPRADISPPLMQAEPWLWRRRSTGQTIAVVAKTWFNARERAPLEYVARFGGGVPPDDLELVCNPVKQLELARRMAAELEATPVRIKLLADCSEVPHVLSLDEVREALEQGRREAAAVPHGGLRINGSAVPWGEGFEPKEKYERVQG